MKELCEIEFNFFLYEMVYTPLKEEGVITMLGYNGGNCYYVVTKAGGEWYDETLLKKVP